MRSTLLPALALAFVACGTADRPDTPAAQISPSAATNQRGPDNLVLRLPRGGGEARVYAYPRLDTVVWTAPSAPVPERVLAFDDEAGTIAYVDTKGLPSRIDFRQGSAGAVSRAKLTGLTSSDGSTIYGIGADGAVVRYATSGTWVWHGPSAARAVFPQPDATLLVLAEGKDGSVVWRLRPPSLKIVDSVVLPKVNRALRTQVGDRLYLGSDRELTGVRTRTMERTPTIAFSDGVELLAATPSGDRVFVVEKTGTGIQVVDRYREQTSGTIDLKRHIAELRVDALGRYLLARPEGSDSAVVIALGTNRVVGTVGSAWRSDLPFVAPDGGIALAQGTDVIIVDGETLRPTVRVRAGAADFWYPFRWTGFRPRDAKLDRPVEFGTRARDTVSRPADSAAAAPDSSGAPSATAPAASAPAPAATQPTQPTQPTPATPPAPTPGIPAVARARRDSIVVRRPAHDSVVHRASPATPSAAASARRDSGARRSTSGFTVSFAALLVGDKARELAAQIHVGREAARVVTAQRDGATIYRVVLGPYRTREEADRIGRESKQSFWVYEGGP